MAAPLGMYKTFQSSVFFVELEMGPTVDGSEIPFPTTRDGAKTW